MTPAGQTKPRASRSHPRSIVVVNPGHTRAATPGPSAFARPHSASSSGTQPAAAAFHRPADRDAEDALRSGRPGESRPPKPNAPRRALRSNSPCTSIIANGGACFSLPSSQRFSANSARIAAISAWSRIGGCERGKMAQRRVLCLAGEDPAVLWDRYVQLTQVAWRHSRPTVRQ